MTALMNTYIHMRLCKIPPFKKFTLSMLKGVMLLSWLNSASEPNNLASISGLMLVSRSFRSFTEDVESFGSDSSNGLVNNRLFQLNI